MAEKPVVFITGANTGLGLEIVRALAKESKAYDILIGSRSVDKGEDAVATVKKDVPGTPSSLSIVQVDITSDESINHALNDIATQFGKLDVLVNNAGANFGLDIQAGKLSIREGWNKSWDTNVSGTQVITTAAIPLLLKSPDPRILLMTSGTSALSETERFDHPTFERINASPSAGWPKDAGLNPVTAYRSVKTALNMMMREWHRILKNDGVKVWSVSPGFLATGLAGIGPDQLRKMGAREPWEGGQFVKDVIQGVRDQDVGKAIRVDMIQPW